MPQSNGNSKAPILTQTVHVQRSPFTSPAVDSRPAVRIGLHADLTKEYVPSGSIGYYPFLRALPAYIDDISQTFGIAVYENMLKDPVVYASERVYNLALLANGWEIVPSLDREEEGYDIAKKMADFVRADLENLETPYDTILEQHLNAFEFGCSVNELVYKVESGQIHQLDIREKPLQNAVFVADSFNKTVGIMTQRFPGQIYPANSYIPIEFSMQRGTQGADRSDLNKDGSYDLSARIPGFLPRYLFSVLTNEMRYNDERGHSGLRSAYQAWWFKQQIIAEYLSYLSKFGSPSVIAKTAQGQVSETSVDDDLTVQTDDDGNPIVNSPATLLSNAISEMSNGTGLVAPFGTEIDVVQPNDTQAFARAIDWCNAEIVRGITYQYLATSEGQHQARAASETHQDILSLGILRRKRWLAAQQQREVYKRLLMYNFDITGKKIARFVPKLNLGYGNGFPMSPDIVARLHQSGYWDNSQLRKLDELIGAPIRESITVTQNGVSAPMSPSQLQEQQRQDAIRKEQQENQDKGDNSFGQE